MPVMVNNTGYLQGISNFKGLIYGKAGVGKTMLATTAPYPLIVATEPGLLSVRRYNIPFIYATTLAELYEVAKWIAGSHEATQYQTFIVDSLSEVLEIILAYERQRVGQKEPRKAYNELLIQALDLIRIFRDVHNYSVVFTAKQEKVQDADTGGMLYGPKFPGKQMGVEAPYFFDFVFNLSQEMDYATGQVNRFLRCHPDNQYEAKDRSGFLFPREPANLQYIFQKAQGLI